MHTILLNVINDFHGEGLVPSTIQEESEVVHLQQIARWGLIFCSRQNRELNYRSHFKKSSDGVSYADGAEKKTNCKGVS